MQSCCGHIFPLWAQQRSHTGNVCKCLCSTCALTSMRVKDASHCLPALSAAVEGWFPVDGGWHGMLRSIRHRRNLSRRVHRSVRVDSVESEDHGGIPSCSGILPGCCVVLWGRVSCFGLQESAWGSAANTVTLCTMQKAGEDTTCLWSTENDQHYTSVKWFFRTYWITSWECKCRAAPT